MAYQSVDVTCPGCGAPVNTGMETCKYCHRPVMITSFASAISMPQPDLGKYIRSYEKMQKDNPDDPAINKSIGICYILRGNYDRAIDTLERAIDDDPDDADAYYFASVAMLKGKKAFLAQRKAVDKIVEYLQTATQLGSEYGLSQTGLYYYFLAYVAYDYFARKRLNVTPSYNDYLAQASLCGVTTFDMDELHSILKTPRPTF